MSYFLWNWLETGRNSTDDIQTDQTHNVQKLLFCHPNQPRRPTLGGKVCNKVAVLPRGKSDQKISKLDF